MTRVASPPDSISASQLDAFASCPRKWGWRKLDRVPDVAKPAAEFGGSVHEHLEKWLEHATPIDLTQESGECALSALPYLPKPGTPGMMVEKPFILLGWGHTFFGFKDIELPGPVVWDHKTSSDPKKWGLTTETLPSNLQAVLYATESMVRTGSDSCELVWSYLKSKRPYKAGPLIRVKVTRTQIEPILQLIKGYADEIKLIRSLGLKALDLPYNASACEDYGGCPYQANCNLSPAERLSSIMANPPSEAEKAALYARLAAKRSEQGTGDAVNPPVAMNGASVQLSPDGKFRLDPASNSWVPHVVEAAPRHAPPPPPPAPVDTRATWQKSPDGAFGLNPATNGWEPYSAPPPPPPAPVAAPPPPPPPPPPAAGESPIRRGRPKGSKNKGAPPPVPGSEDAFKVMLAEQLRAMADYLDGADPE